MLTFQRPEDAVRRANLTLTCLYRAVTTEELLWLRHIVYLLSCYISQNVKIETKRNCKMRYDRGID